MGETRAHKLAVAICYAESHFGTHYAKPEVEKDYHNCGGLKSEEIMKTRKADKDGSWLRKFDSWTSYFNHAADRLQKGYIDKGCASVECIGNYYVGGGASKRWEQAVNGILNQL